MLITRRWFYTVSPQKSNLHSRCSLVTDPCILTSPYSHTTTRLIFIKGCSAQIVPQLKSLPQLSATYSSLAPPKFSSWQFTLDHISGMPPLTFSSFCILTHTIKDSSSIKPILILASSSNQMNTTHPYYFFLALPKALIYWVLRST